MLLEKLCEYSERRDLPPTMYDKVRIKWLIDLDLDGRFRAFVQTEGTGKKNDRGKEYWVPHLGKTSGIKAKLLAENGEYVLGLARDPQKKEKVPDRHQAFLEQVRRCATTTNEPAVQAVLRFLEDLDLTKLLIPKDLNPSHNLTFRVENILPIHLESVRGYWASGAGKAENGTVELSSDLMQCLICGKQCNPVRRLPFKIKRIPGRQLSGMALISANQKAFESYGLEESLIAPTCQDCGERFSKAANDLIENERTHITIGPLVYLFWTREEHGFSVATLLSTPEPDEVKTLLGSAIGGKKAATDIDETPFYATAFSASGGRIVVRDWLETTIGTAKANLARWFQLQSIIGEWGETAPKPLPIQGYLRKEAKTWVEGLTECVVPKIRGRRNINQVNPNVPKLLLHTALRGGPLSMWLLFQAVKRNRAEQGITRPRAALIKMVLLSREQHVTSEDTMENLDSSNRDPAYLCGRLFALLEAVQRAAIPGSNTTITDRFFGTASSAPASVFGRLLRGAQAHLNKLRKEKPGTYEALQRRLEDVQISLTAFPRTLTLEKQGLFSLGYYHQRAADRAGAIAYRQAHEHDNMDLEPNEAD